MRVHPGAMYVRHWPLTGGVSAQTEALEIVLPGGEAQRVVVRRHSSLEWKTLERNVTANEFALQDALFRAGLPVPEPLLLDVSATVFPEPLLVMAMVDGTTVVEEEHLPNALQQMADFLVRLHSLEILSLGVPLPRREDPVIGALDYVPDTASQAELRAAIAGWATQPSEDAVLHGDFWPGNVMWRDNRLAAVIDWEDAAVGPAVSDLATCRAELMVMFGEAAMEVFTERYLAATTREISDLTLWEIYVGSAALATMADWGLAPDVEALRRERTTAFVNRAARALINQG